MSITTKTGDKGYSSILNKRVKKDDQIFEAIGTLDELQSIIEDEEIQKDLYEIMGVLAVGEKDLRSQISVIRLEKEMEKLEKKLKPVTKFLIFKKERARKLNWIRTVCRRAERRVVFLKNKNILIYLNRLSDYYYLLARLREDASSR